MAFILVTTSGQHHQWKLSEKKPAISQDPICYLYADSDELVMIIDKMRNIPYTLDKCMWRGEQAAFIFDNL